MFFGIHPFPEIIAMVSREVDSSKIHENQVHFAQLFTHLDPQETHTAKIPGTQWI